MAPVNPVAACDFVVFGGTGDLAVRNCCPPSICATSMGSCQPRRG